MQWKGMVWKAMQLLKVEADTRQPPSMHCKGVGRGYKKAGLLLEHDGEKLPPGQLVRHVRVHQLVKDHAGAQLPRAQRLRGCRQDKKISILTTDRRAAL
eukprot:scaffold655622_cov83-Prasinocladus_malaysianus.AAC.1